MYRVHVHVVMHLVAGEKLESPLPEYWSRDLQCALHLNLSIAFKSIGNSLTCNKLSTYMYLSASRCCVLAGNIREAVKHAKIYCVLIKDYTPEKRIFAEGHSHQNVGILHELLGEYEQALEHYREFLRMSKQKKHRRGVAQAHGCLGSIYAQLHNRQLSMTYHEQHVALARKMGDRSMLSTAYELMADSLMILEDFALAADCYDEMYKACPRSDPHMRATSMCKLGQAQRKQRRYQHAIFYLERARDLADNFRMGDVKVQCDFFVASMLQFSTQHADIDRSYQLFRKLIPLLEAKHLQHQDEGTFCPEELTNQIDECYNGIQSVVARIGNGPLALQYSESQKKKRLASVTQSLVTSSPTSGLAASHVSLVETWAVEKMMRVVNQQNATVVYYQTLCNHVLIWLLKPGVGLERFYTSKFWASDDGGDLIGHVRSLISRMRGDRNLRHAQYEMENRSLPLRGEHLELLRNKNRKLSNQHKRKQLEAELLQPDERPKTDAEKEEEERKREMDEDDLSNDPLFANYKPPPKTPDRELFDLLLSPVWSDLQTKSEEPLPLVFVPDKSLCECPFPALRDWSGKQLQTRFRITVCPSLFSLDRVTQNELTQLKLQDDLEFARTQARLGGIPKIMHNIDFMRLNMTSHEPSLLPLESRDSHRAPINLKHVSNPRLVTSNALAPTLPEVSGGRAEMLNRRSREVTHLSMKTQSSLSSIKMPPVSLRSKQEVHLRKLEHALPIAATDGTTIARSLVAGAPTSIDRMLNIHSMTTLTTRTATNTDVTQSHAIVPEFRQVSDPDRCLVIGAPKLPQKLLLHGREWVPAAQLSSAQDECFKVAELCDVTAVIGEKATKDRFLREIQTAVVIHIGQLQYCFSCSIQVLKFDRVLEV